MRDLTTPLTAEAANQMTESGRQAMAANAWGPAAWEASAEARRMSSEHIDRKLREHDDAMYKGAHDAKEFAAHKQSRDAYAASDRAASEATPQSHMAARAAHLNAHIAHFNRDNTSPTAAEHLKMMQAHTNEAGRLKAEQSPAEADAATLKARGSGNVEDHRIAAQKNTTARALLESKASAETDPARKAELTSQATRHGQQADEHENVVQQNFRKRATGLY